MAKKTKKGSVIDCTPKWKNLMPLFFGWIKNGEQSQRNHAENEIKRMAEIVDRLTLHRKHGGLTCKCGDIFELS